jgi:hypothetical protein
MPSGCAGAAGRPLPADFRAVVHRTMDRRLDTTDVQIQGAVNAVVVGPLLVGVAGVAAPLDDRAAVIHLVGVGIEAVRPLQHDPANQERAVARAELQARDR